MNFEPARPWDDAAVERLHDWDRRRKDSCKTVSTDSWTSGVLERKLVELIGVGLNPACTNLNPDGTRRHIRAVLDAWASWPRT